MNIFRTKNLAELTDNLKNSELKKSLGSLDLIMMGIGAIIGTGIFVVTGTIAAQYTGPAITISFILACLVCIIVALSYSELASIIPSAGGVYSYCYTALGEVIAWIAGICVVMSLVLGSATVAAGWSGYVLGVLKSCNIGFPHAITAIPADGGIFNLPATLITLIISSLLIKGTKESTLVNTILVIVKMAAILIFILYAIPSFEIENWNDFAPYGSSGVMMGAASVFLAYTGFDAVATAAEETKKPSRDLPIGIIGSILISATVYVIVSGLMTGMVPYLELNNAEPMAYALRKTGSGISSILVAIGAITGMTTVLIIQMFAASRVLYSIARDGLIPSQFGEIHHKFHTPVYSLIFVSIMVCLIAGFVPILYISNLTSMSVLTSFILVAIAVMKMRIKQPKLHRPFRCPAVFVIAPLSAIASMYLIAELAVENGVAYFTALAVGLIIYVIYGYKHSKITKE
jgi:APA family basic amino acid/polyamine antiporter